MWRDQAYLLDMLTAARDARDFAAGLTRDEYKALRLAQYAVSHALQIIGILAYKNDTKFSLGRHYRDTLSGALMISNERIAAKSASMLLVLKDS